MDTLPRPSHRPARRSAQARCGACSVALTHPIASATGAEAKC